MSSEIDIAGHTISATGGALAYGIVDRVIRFFRDRDRDNAEKDVAKRLTDIESQLRVIVAGFEASAGVAGLVAEMRERLARLEGIEEGRKQVGP